MVRRDPVEEIFGEPEPRFYPGSSTRIPEGPVQVTPPEPDDQAWDANPMMFVFNGAQTEFFTIGALAKALGRSPNTIREWERFGWIPIARFRTKAAVASKTKRLYTRAQVEGIVTIAQEEGLLTARPRNIAKTNFTARVVDLFQRLENVSG